MRDGSPLPSVLRVRKRSNRKDIFWNPEHSTLSRIGPGPEDNATARVAMASTGDSAIRKNRPDQIGINGFEWP